MSNDKKDTRPYWQQRRDMKNKAPHGKSEKEAAKKEDKKSLAKYYDAGKLDSPGRCENCGKSLIATIRFHPRAHQAHIVPKTKQGGCPSVGTHLKNKWFGCLDCHTFYDKEVAEGNFYEVVQMPVIAVIRKRFAMFQAEIIQSERKNIPAFLLVELKNKK